MEFHHVSILLEPCLAALEIKPDGVYVDATDRRRRSFAPHCGAFA